MDDTQTEAWRAERRNMHRLAQSESAEVIDLATGTKSSMLTTDISTGGCFLNTMFPLPVGFRVRVILLCGIVQFAAEGKVVYSQTRRGMGVAFDELNSDQRLGLFVVIETAT